jgi:hypothetical protein
LAILLGNAAGVASTPRVGVRMGTIVVSVIMSMKSGAAKRRSLFMGYQFPKSIKASSKYMGSRQPARYINSLGWNQLWVLQLRPMLPHKVHRIAELSHTELEQ